MVGIIGYVAWVVVAVDWEFGYVAEVVEEGWR
jgi:hypothetical protein